MTTVRFSKVPQQKSSTHNVITEIVIMILMVTTMMTMSMIAMVTMSMMAVMKMEKVCLIYFKYKWMK